LTIFKLHFGVHGFRVGQLAEAVRSMLGATASSYNTRRAAYDTRKLHGKEAVTKLGESRRYCVLPHAIRTIAALLESGEGLFPCQHLPGKKHLHSAKGYYVYRSFKDVQPDRR
jgi:hypothetical protein